MLKKTLPFSGLRTVVASFVMINLCFGTSTPLLIAERHPPDQEALNALEVLQKRFLQRPEPTFFLTASRVLQALPSFVTAMDDKDPYVRFSAIWALEEIWVLKVRWTLDWWPQDKMQRFVEQRFVEKWETAVAATIAVPGLIDRLLKKLDDEDFLVQLQAIKTVATVHEITPQSDRSTQRMLEALLKLTKAPNPFIREAALRNLGRWHNQPAVRCAYREAYQDNTWLVRRFGDPDIAQEALRDEDPGIRVRAIRMLMSELTGEGPQAATELRELLLERVRDPHDEVASEAVFSLIDLKDKKAIGPLLDVLEFTQGKVYGIERALRTLSGKSIAALKQEFQWQPGSRVVEYAPVHQKSQARLQRLYHAVDNGAWLDRLSALLELTWVENSTARAAINKGLGDPDARVRYAAFEVVGAKLNKLGVKNNFQFYMDNIHKALQDSNRHVQTSAINLIEFIARVWPSFVGNRQKIIEEISEKAVHAEDGFIRQAAANAFWTLTDPRYLD